MAEQFLPYGRQTLDEEDVEAVTAVLRSDWLTTGPEVPAFEEELAAWIGVRHAVAVSSGTAALHAACLAAGVGPGDEVVVPAITFTATAACALYAGAEPVFADVDPDSGLLTADEVARRVTSRTRAVIPVHLNGSPADVQAIQRIADGVGAGVIEDAAHGLGARLGEAWIGDCSWSHAATLSFHPVKHVAMGEGGAVVTNDDALAEQLRTVRNHGIVRDPARFEGASPGPWYYEVSLLGHNLRVSDLHCALGRSQLRKLDGFLQRRRELAALYDEALEAVPHVRPVAPGAPGGESAYHLYAVLVDFEAAGTTRAEVMGALRDEGIGTQVHYVPLPLHPLYRRRGADLADFPGARQYYERVLSLPLFPSMQDGDVARVVSALGLLLGLA